MRREKDDHDKRSNKVFLTQKGMDIKDDIHETLSQWEAKISQSIDEEERILMIKLLKKVCSNIDPTPGIFPINILSTTLYNALTNIPIMAGTEYFIRSFPISSCPNSS